MKLSFRLTLQSILLTLLGLTVSVIAVSSYRSAWTTSEELSGQILDQTSLRIDRRLDALLDKAADRGDLCRELIQNGHYRAGDFPALVRYWTEVMRVNPELSNIYLTRAEQGDTVIVMRPRDDGLIVQELRRSRETGQLGLYNFKPHDYPGKPWFCDPNKNDLDQRAWGWYQAGVKAGRGHGVWSDTYVFFDEVGNPDAPGVTYATPVLREDGTLEGVVGVDFTFRELCSFLRAVPILSQDRREFAFVLELRGDGTQQVIAHPNPNLLCRNVPAGGQEKRGELIPTAEIADPVLRAFIDHLPDRTTLEAPREAECTPLRFSADGVPYLGCYRKLVGAASHRPGRAQPRWVVGLAVPEENVLGHARHHLKISIGVGAIALLLAAYVSLLVSRQVAQPLEQLARQAADIGHLRLEARPLIRSVVKEVDQLALASEEMKAGLRSFVKYVPADLVRSLLAAGQEARLGGESRVVTILFSDIADFTTISESLSPAELVEHLGDYLRAMSAEVLAAGGTVDKYIGDAVMAFWGAPCPNPCHALAACTAVLRCQQRLVELRGRWKAEGRPLFFTRFGLHTGEVVVGNIGSEARLNYTVIGDAVNLASRLEGLNKYYGTGALLSESTYREVQDRVVARPLDWVSVKGKRTAVLVYELLGLQGEVDPEVERAVTLYGVALAHYRRQEWDVARDLFNQVLLAQPDDGPAREMIRRCESYQGQSLGPDWDGVHHMAGK